MNEQKAVLRGITRGGYDIQKQRIMAGNRIVAARKAKLGQLPSTPESEIEEEAKAILHDMRMRYDSITEACVENSKGKSRYPTLAQFEKKYADAELISTYAEYVMIDQWVSLMESEERSFKMLPKVLEQFPIYTEFLKGVKGVGPAMAAIIVSEIDIHQARYPSSLWRYAGLDVVTKWILQETSMVRANPAKIAPEFNIPTELDSVEELGEDGHVVCSVPGWDLYYRDRLEDEPEVIPERGEDTGQVAVLTARQSGYEIRATFRMFSYGGRSKKRDHLVEVDYIDAKGDPAKRMSITYNPWLKTKLIGVLSGSFIKCGGEYADIYYAYKNRLENHPKHKDGSKGHRHAMALRYMIKMFLIDLYNAWRAIEGLPVHPPYHEAKLGIYHRGENEPCNASNPDCKSEPKSTIRPSGHGESSARSLPA